MHSNYNLAIDQSCHRQPGLTKSFLIQMVYNENFGPGQKVAWADNFCYSNLAQSDQLWLLKLVQPNQKWSGLETL